MFSIAFINLIKYANIKHKGGESLNNVNIFDEYIALKERRSLKTSQIAILCRVSRQTVSNWNDKRKVPDKYLDTIARYLGDETFVYAVFCYKYDFPFIDMSKRYKDNPLTMLIGSVKESTDSSLISASLEQILSLPDNQVNKTQLAKFLKEREEAAVAMMLSDNMIARQYGLTAKQVMIEGRS